jgi:hypothetical protein
VRVARQQEETADADDALPVEAPSSAALAPR